MDEGGVVLARDAAGRLVVALVHLDVDAGTQAVTLVPTFPATPGAADGGAGGPAVRPLEFPVPAGSGPGGEAEPDIAAVLAALCARVLAPVLEPSEAELAAAVPAALWDGQRVSFLGAPRVTAGHAFLAPRLHAGGSEMSQC